MPWYWWMAVGTWSAAGLTWLVSQFYAGRLRYWQRRLEAARAENVRLLAEMEREHGPVVRVEVDGVDVPPSEWVHVPGPEPTYWAHVTDWNGAVVYDGPTPVPPDLVTVNIEDALAGRLYRFAMTPMSELN